MLWQYSNGDPLTGCWMQGVGKKRDCRQRSGYRIEDCFSAINNCGSWLCSLPHRPPYTSPYPWSCSVGWCLAEVTEISAVDVRMGSGSTLGACSQRCTIQIHIYFTNSYSYVTLGVCVIICALNDCRFLGQLISCSVLNLWTFTMKLFVSCFK